MREVKPAWIAAVLFAAVALVYLLTRASEKIGPTPVALWVAIQLDDEDTARSGLVSAPAGTPFSLHAVLEAETFRSERIYFTDAKQLELLGEPVARERIKPWPGRLEARILWFTVEGVTPYREVAAGAPLTPTRFEEVFRADWGRAWTVPGDLRPAVENYLPGEENFRPAIRFGTQRFQVRIELFEAGNQLVPTTRLASAGSAQVIEEPDKVATLVASRSGALEEPARVFGLPQIELVSEQPTQEQLELLASWTGRGLAFSRITVLSRWLEGQGVAFEDLIWRDVELGVSGEAALPGDLLRVGRRLVWLLEDRGAAGLDDEDLCLDFDRGARVHRLGDVFVGEGLVEWASAPTR